MIPVLFRIGPVNVETHDFFVALAVLCAAVPFFYEARRRGMLSDRLYVVVGATLIAGALGAKLSTVWEYLLAAPHPTLLGAWIDGGRSVLGGLAFAYAGALIGKRIAGYTLSTGDLFAPAVALGMAVGRWGCFLTEQVGTPTSLPWGIRLTPEQAAHIPGCPSYCASGVPMHPSFLYEIVFQSAMFGFLWWLRPRVHKPGELFKIYLIAYGVFRFAVEFVRGNAVVLAGLTRPQLFLIPTTLLLAAYFLRTYGHSLRHSAARALAPVTA